MRLLKRLCVLVLGLAMLLLVSSIARADDVTDWNQHMLRAGTVGGTSPLVMSRVAAIVQASVFDAVNGIDRKYAPVHVPPGGAAADGQAGNVYVLAGADILIGEEGGATRAERHVIAADQEPAATGIES